MANPTDIVTNIDTSGVEPGKASTLEGVNPVFDIAAEEEGRAEPRDLSLEERFTEKVETNNIEPDEDDDSEDDESEAPGLPYAPSETSLDTSATDTQSATAGDHVDMSNPGYVNQIDTTGTDGKLPDTSIEGPNVSDGEDASDESTEALSEYKVTELLDLAKENDVDVPSGAKKAEIVDALTQAGVSAPSDDDSGEA